MRDFCITICESWRKGRGMERVEGRWRGEDLE